MNNKTFKKIRRYINKSIKVGDTVQIYDGSGLALASSNDHKDMYIPYAYPKVTGTSQPLKDIKGTVIKTDIEDIVTDSVCNTCYGVDMIVKLGDAEFYTCSQLVTKVVE